MLRNPEQYNDRHIVNISAENKNVNSISNLVENMLIQDNINGWNDSANTTIKNWYKIFKQQSFTYQWILDKNRRMSDNLNVLSIISSSLLGIFSGFKLWIDSDAMFQTVSNIMLMFMNFIVALITALSKRYIDDERNEAIRTYIEEVDSFLGEISAQVLKSPVYRMQADEFFKQNNDKYTRLISIMPNLSIYEISESKKIYLIYNKHLEDPVYAENKTSIFQVQGPKNS
jgi:hypothetical protein